MKTSNKFTLARVLFAPVFFFMYFIPVWTGNTLFAKISACIMIPLLALFQLTDYFDGHYARKNNEVSDFGKLFDPFADVVLNLTLFICATSSYKGISYMPLVLFIFILYREFSMTFLRMVCVSRGTAIAARKGGKFKTVFYITTSFYVLLVESLLRFGLELPFLSNLLKASVVLYSLCVLFSYISFIDYIKTFYSLIVKEK